MSSRYFIAQCSPSGSTARVAAVIKHTLSEIATELYTLEVGREETHGPFLRVLENAGPEDCLFLGSPVYRDIAAPPVMRFVNALPRGCGCHAAPFVTWGGAFSGIALWQMGQALVSRGFRLAGGAKVLAVHSMMWSNPRPMGQGHPNDADDALIRDWTRNIHQRLAGGTPKALPPEALDYNLGEHTAEIKERASQPWAVIPKSVDPDCCTQCAICAEVCPVAAITLADYPQFAPSCFDCFNCIRLCPENAIAPKVSLDQIHANILKRVARFDETPASQVFFPDPGLS